MGEELVCKRERHDVYGLFAVAVLKANNVALLKVGSLYTPLRVFY